MVAASESALRKMTAEERSVYGHLRPFMGAHKARKVSTLADITGLTERRVRFIVKRLVEEYQLPIGSTTCKPYGYYMIENEQELNAVRKNLYNRSISMLKRAQAYDPKKSRWVSNMIGQLELIRDEK